MVTTSKILPSLFWQPFVKCFALREFDAGASSPLLRPLPAMSEPLLAFNLNGSYGEHWGHPADRDKTTQVRAMKSLSWVTGLFGECMGALAYWGKHRHFTIEFTATGFYNIFGWPAARFTSNAFTGGEVFASSMALLEERLCEARSLTEMAKISEGFLLGYIQKRKAKADAAPIRYVAQLLETARTAQPVETLAQAACMSLKSFERKFKEQVGVTPKYFSRIIRFNKALRQKLLQPRQSWTSVAHNNGYFDQMHFIKDCKQFTGMTPAAFLQQLPPPVEILNEEGR